MSILKKSIMKKQVNEISYFKYVISRGQLTDWLVMVLSVAAGCLFVLCFYPFPCMISDSFGYLSAALSDSFIPFRPFGYSAFLQMVNSVSRSLYSIVVSNALIYLLSAGLLMLAVKKYWGSSSKWIFLIFEVLAVAAPLPLFMLNTVLSDSLFCSLILFMLAMFLVMLKERRIIAAVLFVCAFYFSLNVRYSAIFFPLAFLPVLAFYWKRPCGIAGMVGMIAAIMVYYGHRSDNMKDAIGRRQFSTGFEGWQLANNGLHVIPFLEEGDEVPADPEVAALHRYCSAYKDLISQKTADGTKATANFMWIKDSPLKQILFYNCQTHNEPYLQGWVGLGSGLYSKYGKWLILHHPGKFMRYYLWPNMKQMFVPDNYEIVGSYMEVPDGKAEVERFFDIRKGTSSTPKDEWYKGHVREVMTYLELVTWLILLVSVIRLTCNKSLAEFDCGTRRTLLMLFLFGFIYYGTTTFASPIAIRYWMPMHAVKLVFAWIAFKMIFDNACRKGKTAER